MNVFHSFFKIGDSFVRRHCISKQQFIKRVGEAEVNIANQNAVYNG